MMSFARFCRESIYILDSSQNHPAKRFEKSYLQMLKMWQLENRKSNLDGLIDEKF